MKFLLAAINAKYIHSNPGIYSLKAFAQKRLAKGGYPADRVEIEIGEYTINNQMDFILADIYKRKPKAVGFSCYIWNIAFVLELVRDLPKVLPDTKIWLGGPEVSYDVITLLDREKSVTGIMLGEGEETFYQVLKAYLDCESTGRKEPSFLFTEGVAVRDQAGKTVSNPVRSCVDMNELPFLYEDLSGFENRIIYYETSRGCPFSCSYCLSSLDKSVRFRNLDLVKRELKFFLEKEVPQVKFVDRTFNCRKNHTKEIWTYLLAHDNGVTNFHFEISADLIDEEELLLLSQMRPGLVQLEIGVQSTNPAAIEEIRRKTDLGRLRERVAKIKSFHNIHQHLDLIAGLPFEDFHSFRNSFNQVYDMEPDQLQLGFLKVLKGSCMAKKAGDYGLLYRENPPYEVLCTNWLDYGEVLRLKAVEEMVEVYYNSGQFTNTLKELVKEFDSPFDLFLALGDYYEGRGLFGISHSRMARYEILEDFIKERAGVSLFLYQDLMVHDLYLRENLKSRPNFGADQEPYKERIRAFFQEEAARLCYLKEGYEGYEARQLIKMAHIEVFQDGRAVLFDYKKRDALTGNAFCWELGNWKEEIPEGKEETPWQSGRRG